MPLPHTLDAIGDHLRGGKRMEFYREIGALEQGTPAYAAALEKWWMAANSNAYGTDRDGFQAAMRDHIGADSVPLADAVQQISGRSLDDVLTAARGRRA